MKLARVSSLPILALFLGLLAVSCDSSKKPDDAGGALNFVDDVKPLIETHCIRCHNDESLFGGLNLMNREKAFRGSVNGPVLVAGEPDRSLFYAATSLEHGKDPKAMPATGPKLTPGEKEIIRKWIEQGADWPEGKDGFLAPLRIEPDEV